MTISSVVVDGTNIKVSWLKPAENSAVITAYKILVRKSDGNYIEDLGNCDGSQVAIVSQQYCLIPMTTLRSALTFNLAFNDLVIVRI